MGTFEGFFDAESGRLGKAMYLLTGDRAEAEDLAQEALVRVYERWGRVSRMDSPGGYLYRVAINLWRRRARRRPPRLEPASPVPGPEAEVEARSEVMRLLQSLTRDQREALVLVEWLGMSSEEAGAVLGIEPGSVRTRLHRARTALVQKEADDA